MVTVELFENLNSKEGAENAKSHSSQTTTKYESVPTCSFSIL